jgi:hypothetical protein
MIEIGNHVVVTGYRLRLQGRANVVQCEPLGSIPLGESLCAVMGS